MIILLGLAAGLTTLFSVMALQFKRKSHIFASIFFLLIIANLILFVMTLCGEMGVPKSVYERYYKLKYIKEKTEDADYDEKGAISENTDNSSDNEADADVEAAVQKYSQNSVAISRRNLRKN